MSKKNRRRLQTFNEWLEDRDTVFYEGGLGVTAIINAWQVLSVDAYGHHVAPFLYSALTILSFDKILWACVLSLVGAIKIIALVHGQMNDNSLVFRARISLVAAGMWSVMALAIIESSQPRAVAATYVLRWSISVMVYLALHARARARKRLFEQHPAIRLVVPVEKGQEAQCG